MDIDSETPSSSMTSSFETQNGSSVFHRYRFRILGILAILVVLTSIVARQSEKMKESKEELQKVDSSLVATLDIDSRNGLKNSTRNEVKRKGSSVQGGNEEYSARAIDAGVAERLRREITLKAESTRRKKLLAKAEKVDKNQTVSRSEEGFSLENVKPVEPTTAGAVLDDLRQKNRFRDKGRAGEAALRNKLDVEASRDPYLWLSSIAGCEQALDLFRARYAPFGPYSQLAKEQKQNVDGAVRILCGEAFKHCDYSICSTSNGGKVSFDPKLMKEKYNTLLKSREKTRKKLLQAGSNKKSKGDNWQRFSLEESSSSVETIDEQAGVSKKKDLNASEKRYYDARRRRNQRKNR